jgi:hypothetical protein
MKYLLVTTNSPDIVLNPITVGSDKLAHTNPSKNRYPTLWGKITESINNGYQSRYYTELDSNSIDPDTNNVVLTREYTSLEGARDLRDYLIDLKKTINTITIEAYINQIDSDGTVTRVE